MSEISTTTQNAFYLGIIAIVFTICSFIFPNNYINHSKGVFLPSQTFKIPSVSVNNVTTYDVGNKENTLYEGELENSLGMIRVLGHVSNKKDFAKICKNNLEVAKKLTAEKGGDILKYMCFNPQGKLTKLSEVTLMGYAFKEYN